MKKILFLLLSTCAMYGQIVPTGQEQDFDYGIRNNVSQLDDNAVFITVQNSDGVQGKSTSSVWAKKIYVDNADVKKSFLSTGLIKNGILSINADPTKYNLSAGSAVFSDFSNPDNVTTQVVNFAAVTGKTPTFLNTSNITYVGVNSSGAIEEKASPFTSIERRTIAPIGAVIHSNLLSINTINGIATPPNDVGAQMFDFMEAVGTLNTTGNVYSPSGANMMLNKSAGTLFKAGSNFYNDWRDPNKINQAAGTSITFRYRTQTGLEGVDRVTIDPDSYDVGGVVTAVPNNKWTIQTIYIFQSGLTRIQWGQALYNSLSEAKNAIPTRSYIEEANNKLQGVKRCFLIVMKGETALNTFVTDRFNEAQKFGGTSSGGVALTNESVTAALGYTAANDADVVKKITSHNAETAPLNLFKINPFTSGYESFGLDFNSYPNSGAGAGTYNHGMWLGYNTGWHSGTPRTTGKPSIMLGFEDNYFDNDFDNNFGTEFYVQGYSPNGTTVQMSRPYYARGFLKDDGTNAWIITSNIGSSGVNRFFRVDAGVNNPLMELTPTLNRFYKDIRLFSTISDAPYSFNFSSKRTGIGSLGEITWTNNEWSTAVKASIKANTDTSINNASLVFSTASGDVAPSDRMIIKANGNLLVNTSTDNGTDKLQINGTVSGSAATLSNQFVTKSQLDTKQNTITNPITGTGTTNYLSKFTGASTLGNSLVYDNGTNVGIGTTSAGVKFVISGAPSSSTATLGSATSGSQAILSANGLYGLYSGVSVNGEVWQQVQRNDGAATAYNLLLQPSGGRLLIGTTTDNTVDKLQINGTVSATTFKGGAALTGTPTAPTATAGTNTTQIATTAFVQNIKPYKVYVALLSQTGTNAPVATVLENTLGGIPSWAYSSTGLYTAILTGAFTTNKTTLSITGDFSGSRYTGGSTSVNDVVISTYNSGGSASNGLMSSATIEIRVYN